MKTITLDGTKYIEAAEIAASLRSFSDELFQLAETVGVTVAPPAAPKKKAAPPRERKPRTSSKALLAACERALAAVGLPLRTSAIVEALAACMPPVHVRQKSVDRALKAAGYVCGVDGWAKPGVQG